MTIVTTLARRVITPRVVDRIPVPLASRRSTVFSSIGAPASDLAAQMRAMSTVGVLFAIVDKLATGTASVNWTLYRKARSGKEEDRVEVTTHPALAILNKPNSFMTRQELFETSQQHQDLTGECWWIIARNPRVTMPLEIWPVRPDRMKPVTSATDFITGYEYSSPDGEKVPLTVEDVIFIRRPNPLDPFRGIGPVQAVLSYIDGEKYSAEWNRNFFLNGAIPGGIIEVERHLSDPEFDEMSTRWKEQHQGVANAHRVAILEAAKWVDVKYTNKDMQFTELSALADEKVRQAFSFPKPLLGSVDDVNRANAEAASYVFAEWCLKPRLERYKGALNVEFLPLFPGSDQLEFDYDSPTPEDSTAENAARDSKVKAAVELIKAGFEVDPVLEWLSMPTLPYVKPAPPPQLVSPPPGQDGGSGAGLPDGQDEQSDEEGESGETAAKARLVREVSGMLDRIVRVRDRGMPW